MKRLLTLLFSVLVIIELLSGCSLADSNDGKCDICGAGKYAKLSDGNEYCYKHWKKAIDYYLNG